MMSAVLSNSKLDQIHRGLQLDRQRRSELQRKRMTMRTRLSDKKCCRRIAAAFL